MNTAVEPERPNPFPPPPQCLHESGRFQGTGEDGRGPRNRCKWLTLAGLRPQLARRQLIKRTHNFGFDSRRLQTSLALRASFV
jgi:hypothetical protein